MFVCLYVPPLAGDSAQRRLWDPALHSAGLNDGRHPNAAAALGTPPLSAEDAARDARGALASLAREFSPRVEVHGAGLVTLDAHGLERLFGDARHLGDELRCAASQRGLPARIALASTRTTAWLLAHARAGLTIVPPGEEQAWLSPLPLHVLEQIAANGLGPGIDRAERAAALVSLLKRWGLRTLGDFTALPSLELSERLGQEGLAWQAVARGDELAPPVPDDPEERFEETLDLEWPIEGLEPLSFVFGRLFEALSARLIERDRAAAVLHIHLQLVTREVDRRSLQLPAAMRDPRVLRTLAMLHLETHPVTAGIDRVTVSVDPVPGRVIQCSLLTRALPFPEQMSTLLARLGAVMGDLRCGMVALVDSYRPGAFEMKPFSAEWHRLCLHGGAPTPRSASSPSDLRIPVLAIRRFRLPVPASVAVKDGRPVRVVTARRGLRGGSVEACAGPWRTSGEWWRVADARVQVDPVRAAIGWNRDEWDVNLADGGVYRIYRDRERDRWFVDGIID